MSNFHRLTTAQLWIIQIIRGLAPAPTLIRFPIAWRYANDPDYFYTPDSVDFSDKLYSLLDDPESFSYPTTGISIDADGALYHVNYIYDHGELTTPFALCDRDSHTLTDITLTRFSPPYPPITSTTYIDILNNKPSRKLIAKLTPPRVFRRIINQSKDHPAHPNNPAYASDNLSHNPSNQPNSQEHVL